MKQVVSFRVNNNIKDLINNIAQKTNKTKSEIVSIIIENGLKNKIILKEVDSELIQLEKEKYFVLNRKILALNKISNNINQMSKLANAYNQLNKLDNDTFKLFVLLCY